ncbi:GntR family transcriptional regulator [Streptomyces sp. NPDC044571]|uniref:GntR family transcriptional regulator n=1 Tax=Streptomyces sp. NPDC044571 TaxID=3155371 RepID=UPI0033F6CC51
MPSPSRGGGPAALPKYQRIAAELRRDLESAAAQGAAGRLPSERNLAARYGVNRQTVRAALQQLREDGLIVTGRRGTRSAAAGAVTADRPHPARQGDGRPQEQGRAPGQEGGRGQGRGQSGSWLTLVTVPPSLAALLGMRGGEPTLVLHDRERGPAGQTLWHAVTYLRPDVVAATTELAGYLDRSAVRDEDLGPLHRWLERTAEEGRIAETLTMTRRTHPPAAAASCGLSVRRTLHDRSGRLLAVTDLAFPTWDRLTFTRDRRDRIGTGFRVS